MGGGKAKENNDKGRQREGKPSGMSEGPSSGWLW